MIPLYIGAQTKRATSPWGGGPSWRLGRRLVVMGSPYCVEPAFGGEWHASVGDTNRAPLPLVGVPLAQPCPFIIASAISCLEAPD
jgi:hypothetical protein